jgi:mono/diheme cytochrome c family protein
MRQIKLGRAGIGIAVVACAIALAAPTALALRATSSTPKNPGPGNIARGQVIFNGYFCAACHTLKAAGPQAYGQLGVNLNKVKGGVQYETARAVVINGLPAALPLYPTQMVGYRGVLDETQTTDVATFVSRYSGTYQTCSECTAATTTTTG